MEGVGLQLVNVYYLCRIEEKKHNKTLKCTLCIVGHGFDLHMPLFKMNLTTDRRRRSIHFTLSYVYDLS